MPFWTAEEARRAINEGLRAWNAITGFWRDRITPVCPVQDNYVPLPGHLAFRSRVEFNNVPLKPTSLLDLDAGRPSWEGETTAASGVPSSPSIWAPVSVDLIVIWPALTPQQSGTLTIDGIASTPILVNAGDFIDLGQEEHNQLLGYALHVLSFKYGGEIFSSTLPLYKDWIRVAGEKNEQFRQSSLYRRVMYEERQKQQEPVRAPTVQQNLLKQQEEEQLLPRYIRPPSP